MNNLSNLTTSLLTSTPENIHGVGYGFKEKKGQLTKELSIIFNVLEKKPLSAIPQNEILPATVTFDGVTYTTDVIETPQVSANYCYADDSNALPVSLHMASRIPYVGGICISWPIPTQPGFASTGTMGLICVDTTDNSIVALTNAHVGVLEPRNVGATSLNAPATFDNTRWTNYQSLPWSYLSTLSLKRYMPFASTNTIDAAVLAVTGVSLINTLSSFKQLNLNYNQSLQFASVGEIDSLVVGGIPAGNPIFKAGRRTGPVGWPGSAPWGSEFCSVTATQLFYSTFVNFGNLYFPFFTDTIVYKSNNIKASDSGDSGSAVCALYNRNSPTLSAWKVIGLNFAGGGNVPNAVGIACRIDNICQTLQLTAWQGQPITVTNPTKEDIQYVDGKSSAPFITQNGKLYWQMGTTA